MWVYYGGLTYLVHAAADVLFVFVFVLVSLLMALPLLDTSIRIGDLCWCAVSGEVENFTLIFDHCSKNQSLNGCLLSACDFTFHV